jgi:CheY-like chemotaxis protein
MIDASPDQEPCGKHAQTRLVCLDALGQMASGIVHDFNNLLMPIMGLTDFILSDPELMNNKEELTEILQEIAGAATVAKERAARFRDFYRPFDVAEECALNVRVLIDAALQETEPLQTKIADAGTLTVTVDPAIDTLPAIRGIDSSITKAIGSVVTNSLEAMPTGGDVRITGKQNGQWVVLTISDTGSGMSCNVRRRCFEPLFTTKRMRAAGMGLAATYGTIRRHDGAITIASALDEGTTIELWLPTDATVSQSEAAALALEPLMSHRILIVESDIWSIGRLRRYLGHDQHKTEIVSSGPDALARASTHDHDLVILGSSLPDISSDTMLVQLEQVAPDLPVLVLNSHPAYADCPISSTHPAATITSPPLTRSSLQLAMAEALRKRD